jgi:hypothetical protein
MEVGEEVDADGDAEAEAEAEAEIEAELDEVVGKRAGAPAKGPIQADAEVDSLEAVEAAAEANSSKGEDDDVCFFVLSVSWFLVDWMYVILSFRDLLCSPLLCVSLPSSIFFCLLGTSRTSFQFVPGDVLLLNPKLPALSDLYCIGEY